jgi:hypothetical protein
MVRTLNKPFIRYYTFRFLRSEAGETRDVTVASSAELDARAAGWAVLRDQVGRDFQRDAWRLLSTIIRPVPDLAATLAD